MTPVADQEAHKQFAQALRLMEESRTQERYSALESMVKAEKLLRLALHSVGLYQQTDIILQEWADKPHLQFAMSLKNVQALVGVPPLPPTGWGPDHGPRTSNGWDLADDL